MHATYPRTGPFFISVDGITAPSCTLHALACPLDTLRDRGLSGALLATADRGILSSAISPPPLLLCDSHLAMHDVRHGAFLFFCFFVTFSKVESDWLRHFGGLDSSNFCHLPLIASPQVSLFRSLRILWDVLFDLNQVPWQLIPEWTH